jgi:hypothetical protein
MRRLRQLVFRDLGLKLLALAISFSLWAVYTAEPFAQVAYNVPLAYVNVPPGLVVSGIAAGNVPATVRVILRGRSGLLRRLVPADLDFVVDLAGTRAGEVPVRLKPDMVRVPYGTEVMRITPSDYAVTLVPTTTQPPGPE